MIEVNTKTTGGQQVVEGLRKFMERFQDGSDQVLVGVPQGAGEYEDGLTIATVAAVNNFGSADGRIPERNFMHSAINENQAVYRRLAELELPKVGRGLITMDRLLHVLGELATGHIQEKIVEGPFQANAASTIAKKGSDRPLIDTGNLRQSISYVIPPAGEQIEEGIGR